MKGGINMEEESITQQIAKLKSELAQMQEPSPKQFKLPLGARIARGKVLKKEWVHVILIRTNGSIQIKTLKVEDDTVKFGDYFYDARAGNILRWKGMPVLIIKEWNISPEVPPASHTFESDADYVAAETQGKLTASQRLIYTKMKLDSIKNKMNLNMGTILIILLILGGGYFALSALGYV